MECGGKRSATPLSNFQAVAEFPHASNAKRRRPQLAAWKSTASLLVIPPMPHTPRPHAPLHRLAEGGTFFVTVGTYQKQHHFVQHSRISVLHHGLLTMCRDFGWHIDYGLKTDKLEVLDEYAPSSEW